MKLTNRFFLSFLVFMGILWIPIEGISNQEQTAIQSLEGFLSIPLGKDEVAFMCLGPYSNVIVRVADKTVLFDPATLSEEELTVLNKHGVDLVIYTHGHFDHFDADTASKLFKGSQPYVAVAPELTPLLKKDISGDKLISTASGQSFSAGSISIDTLEGEHVGPIMLFRITIDGIKIFHGGDSAYIPLQTMTSHLAFVPTGSPSPTCNPKYAFQMVSDVKPQIAVPMHGTDNQHNEFKKLVDEKIPDVKVIISKQYVAHVKE